MSYDWDMAFGRNPHVVKAQAAELKATEASDDIARAMAHRDAAHQWERAAEREKPGKHRDEYQANATKNRALADGGGSAESHHGNGSNGNGSATESDAAVVMDPKQWN